jgi:hypothetical protein
MVGGGGHNRSSSGLYGDSDQESDPILWQPATKMGLLTVQETVLSSHALRLTYWYRVTLKGTSFYIQKLGLTSCASRKPAAE